MMFDYLTMIAGAPVPLPELQVNLNQPTIAEIAIIGESRFYSALSLFNIDKEKILSNLDKKIQNETERFEAKSRLSSMDNFDILMEMVHNTPTLQFDIEMILLLVMPTFSFVIEERFILASSATMEKPLLINNDNFDYLKDAILEIFCINKSTGGSEDDFNPANDAAKAIAEKLRKGRERVRQLNGDANKNISLLGTYVSRLGIGSNSLNILNAKELTVFQLVDQMKVFGLWSQHCQGLQATFAGAKDVEIVDWLKSF